MINLVSFARTISPFPEKYTSVLPATLKAKDFIVPAVQGCVSLTDLQVVAEATKTAWNWLDTVMGALKKQDLEKTD